MFAKAVVLLVEDSKDDILLIQRAFEEAGLGFPLQVVRSAQEAKTYLRGELLYSNRTQFPLPALILLDLKMPGEDGFEFLEWVRREPGLSSIPVVALTASDQIKDVNRAYQLGANSFLVKPQDFEDFVETSRHLQIYWLKLSML